MNAFAARRTFSSATAWNKSRSSVCASRLDAHLDRGDALILFDNFETVAHETAIVRWLAALPPQARILITTREIPSGLPGSVIVVHELCPAEARSLFIGRASRCGAAPQRA